LLVQTDHITGEKAATAIEALYGAGARNVQVQSTVTKKNRPGLVFLIDTDPACREDVEAVILTDIGATGWHRIPTEHCYVPVDQTKREAIIRVKAEDGDSAPMLAGRLTLVFKVSSADPEVIRPEHDTLIMIRTMLANAGKTASLALIEQKTVAALLQTDAAPAKAGQNDTIVTIDF